MKSPILYGHGVADTMSDIIILTNVVIGQIVAMADGIVNARLEEHHKDGIQVWETLTYIDQSRGVAKIVHELGAVRGRTSSSWSTLVTGGVGYLGHRNGDESRCNKVLYVSTISWLVLCQCYWTYSFGKHRDGLAGEVLAISTFAKLPYLYTHKPQRCQAMK
jgi:hypothetical protein